MSYISRQLAKDESGFASIVIALVLIIILGLLTIGFAQLARREQQNALNKQLANQAYDAAETGINDAQADIKNQAIFDDSLTGGSKDTSTTACMNTDPTTSAQLTAHNALVAHPTIDSTNDVSYSCLLVDLIPTNIQFSDLGKNKDEYITFTTNSGPGSPNSGTGSFTIEWNCDTGQSCSDITHGKNNNTYPADTNTSFSQEPTWIGNDYLPVIQFSVTPVPTGNFSRSQLISNSFTAYLYPAASSTNNSYAYTAGIGNNNGVNGDAPVMSGHCSTANYTNTGYPCKATITGFGGAAQFIIHVVDYYQKSNILIEGQNPLNGKAVFIKDGQASIDVTGKAHNVLKRLQVRVPVAGNAQNVPEPTQAVEGQAICKRESTAPVSADNPNGTTYDSNGQSAANAACSFGGVLQPS